MISLYDLLEAAQGQLIGPPGARLFHDLAIDPRLATQGSLFAVLPDDEESDLIGYGDDRLLGMNGARAAIARGATGLLCSVPPDFDTAGVSVLLVRDVAGALMRWSHDALGRSGAQVVGVAGVTGKNTAMEAIRHVLSTRYIVRTAVADSTRGRLDIPMTLARMTSRDQIVVLPLDATRPGEMAEMVGAVRPHVGVLLHVGEHASDRFDSADHYAAEMAALFDYLSPTGLAVLSDDDDRARALASRTRAGVITIGVDRFDADLSAYNIVLDVLRTGFDLRFGDQRFVGRWTPLLGKPLLRSVLAGLALGIYYDVPMSDALHAITELEALPGRMRSLYGRNGSLIIDDSHNAGPESAEAFLEWLRAVTHQRHRVLFVMGDLDVVGVGGSHVHGSESGRAHRRVGQRVAEFAGRLVTEGVEAAGAGRAAADAGMRAGQIAITYSAADAVEAVLAADLTDDDVIAITGGRRARAERISARLLADPKQRGLLPRASLLDTDAGGALRVLHERSSWVEIDLDALANNIRQIKRRIGQGVALFAVVKADAYGHGAVAVARTALRSGAEYLAVASVAEAMVLREAGISAPILVMSYTPVNAIRTAIRAGLTITVYDPELAHAYDRVAHEMGERLRVHVKIDTGMGRLGVLAADAPTLLREVLNNCPGLTIEGIYTHFATADEAGEDGEAGYGGTDDGRAFAAMQMAAFRRLIAPLQKRAPATLRYLHAANSAGTLASPDFHLNAVRVGIALYGISPFAGHLLPPEFRPVMTWKTRIAQVKTLPPGHPVGYGGTYRVPAEYGAGERVAVLPVGYADGLRRAPDHWGEVLVAGQRAPIRGRVSMEKTVISVDHLPGTVNIGDEVVLLGAQGEGRITAEAVAAQWGTIGYEVVTSVLARIPRT